MLNNRQLQQKLPGKPILVVTPSGPLDIWHSGTARSRHWSGMLSQLGKLVTITMSPVGGERGAAGGHLADQEEGLEEESATPVGHFLQQMITAVSYWRLYSRCNVLHYFPSTVFISNPNQEHLESVFTIRG